MAGITNVAFRRLCREQGAGIYVCEMITTVALAHRNPKTEHLIELGTAAGSVLHRARRFSSTQS